MASAAPLTEIDKRFLQCAICDNQLKEPKILSCLHLYCRECVEKIVTEKGKKVKCPTCHKTHILPKGGTDSLKTDFHTKNIIEFIQSQESIKHAPQKVCVICSQNLRVTSFCFQCNDFLCQSCGERHKTSGTVHDHRPHIFSLSELEEGKLTIAELTSLKDGPRCHHHPEKVAELCCISCNNLPICVSCTHGDHQGHEVKEVRYLAKTWRGRLTEKVTELLQYKDKLYRTREEMRKTSEELCQQFHEKIRNLQEVLSAAESEVTVKIRKKEEELKQRQAELTEKLRLLVREQEEARRVTGGPDKVLEEDRRNANAELKKLQQEIERGKKQSQEKLRVVKYGSERMLQSVKTQEGQMMRKKKETIDGIDDIIYKFETSIASVSSILNIKQDWTDVQCIPNLCSFLDHRIIEIREKGRALEMMSNFK